MSSESCSLSFGHIDFSIFMFFGFFSQSKVFAQQLKESAKHFQDSQQLISLCDSYLRNPTHYALQKICRFLHFNNNIYNTDKNIETFCLYHVKPDSDVTVQFDCDTFKYCIKLKKDVSIESRDTIKLNFQCSLLSKQINSVSFIPQKEEPEKNSWSLGHSQIKHNKYLWISQIVEVYTNSIQQK